MNIGNSAISFLQKSLLNVPGDPGTDCEAGGKDLSWLQKFQGLEVSLPQNEFSEERFIHKQGEFYSQRSQPQLRSPKPKLSDMVMQAKK